MQEMIGGKDLMPRLKRENPHSTAIIQVKVKMFEATAFTLKFFYRPQSNLLYSQEKV
jgi:hypothetical protein